MNTKTDSLHIMEELSERSGDADIAVCHGRPPLSAPVLLPEKKPSESAMPDVCYYCDDAPHGVQTCWRCGVY